MKKLYLLSLIIGFVGTTNNTHAQFVVIPDSLFMGYIQYYYPGCMQGNLLDTTCPGITNAKRIQFDPAADNLVKNLDGVQYFDSLRFLDCSGQDLTQLTNLPPLLDTLYCGGNNNLKITTALPKTLTRLLASFCNLDTLPELPSSLRYLECVGSGLRYLPNLPDSIIFRGLFNNLSELPPLPNYVHLLHVGNNPNLHCLPWINTISYLYFDTANIKCVPNYGFVNGSTGTLQFMPLCSSYNPHVCSACQAYFSIYPDPLNPGVYFAQNLSGGTGLSYLWDFGDGSTSTQQFPSHTYATPGNYHICLTVDNGIGCVNTYCDSSYLVFKNEGGLMSQLNVLSPLQIDKTDPDLNFAVYPNPASTNIDIKIDRAMMGSIVHVSDLAGQHIEAFTLSTESKQHSTNNLSNGVYILTLTTPDGRSLKKRLIKQ